MKEGVYQANIDGKNVIGLSSSGSPVTGEHVNPEFWQEKWQKREIAFHQAAANPLLVSFFNQLKLAPGARIFLPLCGKSLDIHWLLAQGYQVVGAELSELAVKELFAELAITPLVTKAGQLLRYASPDIDIFVGDIFNLTADTLGSVDAIYDRAALVALPADMRQRYAKHLVAISQSAPQLVICFEYDQALLAGPPFSVNGEEMHNLYSNAYHLNCLAELEVPGGLKKKCQATELAWLLSKQ